MKHTSPGLRWKIEGVLDPSWEDSVVNDPDFILVRHPTIIDRSEAIITNYGSSSSSSFNRGSINPVISALEADVMVETRSPMVRLPAVRLAMRPRGVLLQPSSDSHRDSESKHWEETENVQFPPFPYRDVGTPCHTPSPCSTLRTGRTNSQSGSSPSQPISSAHHESFSIESDSPLLMPIF